ncbi:MAG: GNAT family N-acetyltransferase [bacterium]|nr:GNAT family N-acetyltransferase [bacterium]
MATIELRNVRESDLPALYEFQREPAGNALAVFPGREREDFERHWRTNVLGDESVVKRTVLADGVIAGSIVCYREGDRRLVGYWLGQEFWGRGVASAALNLMLAEIAERPLHAFVATTNAPSIRVLEKCGFERVGQQRGNHGDDEVEVFVYELTAMA